MNDCYRENYTATIGALNDGAVAFEDHQVGRAAWLRYGLLCILGDEAGPLQVGTIRDYGEGLGILHHLYRNDTWTRVMARREP